MSSILISIIALVLILAVNPLSLACYHEKVVRKHDSQHPYGWTKVMKDANGDFRIVAWKNPSWDWEGLEKCRWEQTQYVFSKLDDAIEKSTEINNKILKENNANQLTDLNT